MGGVVISSVTFFSAFIGGQVGGMLTSFPVLAVSSIVVLKQTMGVDFAACLVKQQFKSAVFSCGIYTLSVYAFYPFFGIFYGTIFALLVSVFVTSLQFYLNTRRLPVQNLYRKFFKGV